MHRRSATLSLPLVGVALLLTAGTAQAHRLEADTVVLPFGYVQVESWFEGGESPHGARVEVYRAGGALLTEGRTNDQGIFVFTYHDSSPLRVVVNAGDGHRAESRVTYEKLTRATACFAVAGLTPLPSPLLLAALLAPVQHVGPSPAPRPRVERATGPKYWRLLLGVSILLSVALLRWRKLRRRRKTARS